MLPISLGELQKLPILHPHPLALPVVAGLPVGVVVVRVHALVHVPDVHVLVHVHVLVQEVVDNVKI